MPAISPVQEAQLASMRAKRKQDRANPMLININDGRLMPNTPIGREDPNYRVYTGPLTATLAQRMQIIEATIKGPRTRVVASQPIIEAEQFDVSTATKEELVAFAFDEYGVVLDSKLDRRVMCKQVMAAGERAAATAALAPQESLA